MIIGVLLTAAVLFLLLYGRLAQSTLLLLLLLFCVFGIVMRKRGRHDHGSVISIDVYAQRSKINHWNVGLKLFFAVACLLICISTDCVPVILFVFVGMGAITVFLGKTKLHCYVSLLMLPVSFIMLSGLAILVEGTPAPLGLLDIPFGSGYLCVTPEGQVRALHVMLKALGSVSCLYMLSLSTPIYHIIAVLRQCKVPAIVIELMYLIYRYLFILLETHVNMVNAASARLGYINFLTSIKTTLHGAGNLFFMSLRRSSDLFSAMESRCYDGQIVFLTKAQRIRSPEVCMICIFLVLTAVIQMIWGGHV